MTTSDQEEHAERRRVTLQDADLRRRQQASTNLDHALAAANDISGGRFGATGTPNVTGATEIPYSSLPKMAASSPWSGTQPEPGIEEPLGYRVDAMPGLETSTGVPPDSPPVATDDPANAPSSGSLVEQTYGGLVSNERAGSSPSSCDDGGFDDAA